MNLQLCITINDKTMDQLEAYIAMRKKNNDVISKSNFVEAAILHFLSEEYGKNHE